MKKKVLVAVVVIFVVLLLASCGAAACEHNYTSSVTKEPTYEEEGITTYVCDKCGDSYTESIEKLIRHVVSTEVLDHTLSNLRCQIPPFSMALGELVNAAVDDYRIKYYVGEEVISKGYVSKDALDKTVDINDVYVAIISGSTSVNPSIPYLSNYQEQAVKAVMVFDKDDNLLSSEIVLCSDLQTFAILYMTGA